MPSDQENIQELLKEAQASEASPRHSRYLVIPPHVLSSSLPHSAQHLCGLIEALCHLKGYCWATNDYLAAHMQCHSSKIDRLIKMLHDQKFIHREVIQDGLKKRRRMWPVDANSNNSSVTLPVMPSSRYGQRLGGVTRNVYINNKDIYIENIERGPPIPPRGKSAPTAAPPVSTHSSIPLQGKREAEKEQSDVEPSPALTSEQDDHSAVGGIQSPPNSAAPPFAEEKIHPEAMRLAQELFDRLQKQNEKQKRPDFQKWSQTVTKVLKIDHRTPDEIRAALKWIFEISGFWCRNIQSPEKLRKHFDAIWTEMHPPETSQSRTEANRETARNVKAWLMEKGEGHLLTINQKYISYPMGEGPSLDIPKETFNDILEKRFGISLVD